MNNELIELIKKLNPWLEIGDITLNRPDIFFNREQFDKLLNPVWDTKWTILVGPRQSGKTTLGKHIAKKLVSLNRFSNLFLLNCDSLIIRQWLTSPVFLEDIKKQFNLENYILFIDEVQRLNEPGLLLKQIADLQLPIKLMASGSSQLEIKSKVQEFLTGRHIECLILPISTTEYNVVDNDRIVYGSYPEIIPTSEKTILLRQLYEDYINKDIIEILKIGKADVMQKLISLLANSSGQLVNYQQLATDCKVHSSTISHYCSILEQTYTVASIKPFVGNKRKEIVSNPIYYFIDNGFRNQALRRFDNIESRADIGLLIESFVFQEIYKQKANKFLDFDIMFWRTKSKAEIDFILHKNQNCIIPVEVKYKNIKKPTVPRAFRSFIDAYNPKYGVIITKEYNTSININDCEIDFISINNISKFLEKINKVLN